VMGNPKLFGAKEIEYPLAEGAGSAEELSASSAALREKSLTGVFRITRFFNSQFKVSYSQFAIDPED